MFSISIRLFVLIQYIFQATNNINVMCVCECDRNALMCAVRKLCTRSWFESCYIANEKIG